MNLIPALFLWESGEGVVLSDLIATAGAEYEVAEWMPEEEEGERPPETYRLKATGRASVYESLRSPYHCKEHCRDYQGRVRGESRYSRTHRTDESEPLHYRSDAGADKGELWQKTGSELVALFCSSQDASGCFLPFGGEDGVGRDCNSSVVAIHYRDQEDIVVAVYEMNGLRIAFLTEEELPLIGQIEAVATIGAPHSCGADPLAGGEGGIHLAIPFVGTM